ncbi:MAG: molybdenum ABC transporter permease subunit [Bacteroidetes bacterium 4572_117]|nr:MAG: molybdenum ABC transporter permease subunit [Bacteroidetes bacterium 4572_117]
MEFDWSPLLLTLKLASITTFILLLIGIPLSYWLAFSKFRFKFVIDALVSMPLVLPPSVLGFYLLVAFSQQNVFGKFLYEHLGLQFVFSFEGLVLASVIFSLPFMVHPIKSGLNSVPLNLNEAAQTLGKSRFIILKKILIPNIKPALLSGIVLSFAHTIGEFGVVLMIGGNIPNQTRVASIAIYDEVEALNYDTANMYALILFTISFSILIVVNYFNKKHVSTF